MEPPGSPTAFESQYEAGLPTLTYSDWFSSEVSSFGLENCTADHTSHGIFVVGLSGGRPLNTGAETRLAVAASGFGSGFQHLDCEALKRLFRLPEEIRGAQGIRKSPRPAPCPGCSRGKRLRRVGREAIYLALPSSECVLPGDSAVCSVVVRFLISSADRLPVLLAQAPNVFSGLTRVRKSLYWTFG